MEVYLSIVITSVASIFHDVNVEKGVLEYDLMINDNGNYQRTMNLSTWERIRQVTNTLLSRVNSAYSTKCNGFKDKSFFQAKFVEFCLKE